MSPLGVVGTVLAGIILLGGAVKAWPAVWGFVKAVGRTPLLVERVYAEFTPNGGGSLRDAVDRLEDQQGQMLQWQADHVADDLRQFGSIREDAKTLDEYVHRRMHDILGELARMKAEDALRAAGVEIPKSDAASGPG